MSRLTSMIGLSMLIVGATGCVGSHQKAKVAAHQRWNNTRAKVLVSNGQDAFKAGDLDGAYRSVTKALSMSPDMPEALELAARISIDRGRYVTAEEHLRTAAQQDPRNPRTVYLLGVVRDRRDQFSDALQLYHRARDLDPGKAAYVLASAEMLVKLNRAVEALAMVEARLKTMDPAVGMYLAAGDLAMLINRPGRAADHYTEARYLDAGDLGIVAKAAKASFFAQRFDRATALLDGLAKAADYRDQAWLWSMLGQCHMGCERPGKAMECFERLISLEPDRAQSWTSVAMAAIQCGNLPRAVTAAHRAMRLAPNDADAAIVLGHALLTQDKPNDALQLLKATAKRHPRLAVVYCLMGQSHDALGRPQRARKCYQTALRIEPDNPIAKKLLSRTG